MEYSGNRCRAAVVLQDPRHDLWWGRVLWVAARLLAGQAVFALEPPSALVHWPLSEHALKPPFVFVHSLAEDCRSLSVVGEPQDHSQQDPPHHTPNQECDVEACEWGTVVALEVHKPERAHLFHYLRAGSKGQ